MSVVLENVFSGYGTNMILHGLTMQATKGAVTCVIGPNGSGKSTLLKTIMGIIKPKEGRIAFDGQNISGSRTDIILRMGMAMCSQARSIFPYMTVAENLELGAYTLEKDLAKERVKEVFSELPILEERKNQLASTLSGGEQRMLEICRARMLHPKTLLLDEPSAMLAPKYLENVFQKIKEINAEGVTMIVVEQNVRKALSVADQVYVLDLGKSRFQGPSKDFLNSKELTKLYLGG